MSPASYTTEALQQAIAQGAITEAYQADPQQVQLLSAGADGRLRGDALALLGRKRQRVEEENSECDRAHGSLQRPQLHTCTAGVWQNSEKMLHGADARPHLDRR